MKGLYRFGAFVGFLVMVQFNTIAQQLEVDSTITTKANNKVRYMNNVFVELGGSGGFYNLGYERTLFKKNKIALYNGIEISYRKIHPSITDYDMVVGMNLLGFTYGTTHQLDAELSVAWAINFSPFPSSISQQLERKRKGQPHSLTFSSMNSIGLGYRYNIKKRWLIRSKILYMFKYDFDLNHYFNSPWFDIGMGFKF